VGNALNAFTNTFHKTQPDGRVSSFLRNSSLPMGIKQPLGELWLQASRRQP
jgi:hypothetical protein